MLTTPGRMPRSLRSRSFQPWLTAGDDQSISDTRLGWSHPTTGLSRSDCGLGNLLIPSLELTAISAYPEAHPAVEQAGVSLCGDGWILL
jgi:hypothetical protein